MGEKYQGICRGGPYSGKPLYHGEDRYYLFKREKKLVGYVMPPGGVKDLPEGMEVGVYEFDGDQWQWSREVE